MPKDTLIALGLHGGGSTPPQEPVVRLLAILADLIAALEIPDDDALQESLEACRRVAAGTADPGTIADAVSACADRCGEALGTLQKHRGEQKQEIASLLKMVQEALAAVSGDGQSFHRHIGSSMDRFEALARIEDVRHLKAELAREVTALRVVAVERQKTIDATLETFKHRVQHLESQLTVTREEATLDALTRIPNRGAFDRTCRRWLKADQKQFVLAMLDLDDFKHINDTHGHAMGDRALILVAQTLKNSVRQDRDFVARIGGDEFAVLVSGFTLPQAESRLRMVTSSLAGATIETPDGGSLTLTLSCGLAEHSAGDTAESLMERADRALYEAKRLGKNRIASKAKPTLRQLLRH